MPGAAGRVPRSPPSARREEGTTHRTEPHRKPAVWGGANCDAPRMGPVGSVCGRQRRLENGTASGSHADAGAVVDSDSDPAATSSSPASSLDREATPAAVHDVEPGDQAGTVPQPPQDGAPAEPPRNSPTSPGADGSDAEGSDAPSIESLDEPVPMEADGDGDDGASPGTTTAAAPENVAADREPPAEDIAARRNPTEHTSRTLNQSVESAAVSPGDEGDDHLPPDPGSADPGHGDNGDAAPAAAIGTATQLPAGVLPAVKLERSPDTPTRGGSPPRPLGAENAPIPAVDLDGHDDNHTGTAEWPIVISSDDNNADDADDADAPVDGQGGANQLPPVAPAEAAASPAPSPASSEPPPPEPASAGPTSSGPASSEPASLGSESPSREAAGMLEPPNPMQVQSSASPAAPDPSPAAARVDHPAPVLPGQVLLSPASAPKAAAGSARPSPQPAILPRPLLAPSPLAAFSRRASPAALRTAATPSRPSPKTPSLLLPQPWSPAPSPGISPDSRVAAAAPAGPAAPRAAASPPKTRPATAPAGAQNTPQHPNGIWHRPDAPHVRSATAAAAPAIPERPNGVALAAPRKFVRKPRADGHMAALAPVPRARAAQPDRPQGASQLAPVLAASPPRPSAAGASAAATPPTGAAWTPSAARSAPALRMSPLVLFTSPSPRTDHNAAVRMRASPGRSMLSPVRRGVAGDAMHRSEPTSASSQTLDAVPLVASPPRPQPAASAMASAAGTSADKLDRADADARTAASPEVSDRATDDARDDGDDDDEHDEHDDDDDDSASDAISELAGLHVSVTLPPPDTELGEADDVSHAHAGAAEATPASSGAIKATSMPPAHGKLAGQDLPPFVLVDWTNAPPDWRTDAPTGNGSKTWCMTLTRASLFRPAWMERRSARAGRLPVCDRLCRAPGAGGVPAAEPRNEPADARLPLPPRELHRRTAARVRRR